MRRMLLVAVAAVGSLLIAVPASAAYWAWLEQFSGPGPLRARKPPLLSTVCVQDGGFQPSPIARSDKLHQRLDAAAKALASRDNSTVDAALAYKRLLANPGPADAFLFSNRSFADLLRGRIAPRDEAEATALQTAINFYQDERANSGSGHRDLSLICAYFDFGGFTNDVGETGVDLNGFPTVTADLFDFGGVARLHDGLDIGGGFGFVRFSSESAQGTIHETRMTLTPLRTVVRPLLLVWPEHRRKKWMGILSLYWKETYIVGELQGADFGAPENSYRSNGELVRSFGVTLDWTALIPTIKW